MMAKTKTAGRHGGPGRGQGRKPSGWKRTEVAMDPSDFEWIGRRAHTVGTYRTATRRLAAGDRSSTVRLAVRVLRLALECPEALPALGAALRESSTFRRPVVLREVMDRERYLYPCRCGAMKARPSDDCTRCTPGEPGEPNP